MGNEINGANAIAGLKAAGTFGTAVTCTTLDRIAGLSIDPKENAEALNVPPIGSGESMLSSVERGNIAPTVTLQGPLGYNSPELAAISQMFGTENVMSMGSGAYMHSVLFNETANQKFTTLAFQALSAATGVIEFPSCSTTKVGLSFPDPSALIQASIDLIGNEYKIANTTNTYASLNNTTIANARKIVWEQSDEFRINAQAGAALTTSDKDSIASAEISYERPMKVAREANGTTGNGVPIADGDYPFVATLTVKFNNLTKFDYITAAKAGTEYKISLVKTSTIVIGGANVYMFGCYFPKMKIVASPEWGLTNPTSNPHTVVFQAMGGLAAIPTGMIDKKPYLMWCNDRATSHLV